MYITKSPSQQIAEHVQIQATELANHVQSVLTAMHAAVSQSLDVQSVLDAYGTSAAKVLADYAALYQAVKAINPETKVPAPDLTVFVPNQDGTVTYAAPPKPEPEPALLP